MAKIFSLLIVFAACVVSCKLHKKAFVEGGGSYIRSIDSAFIKDIQIVHFGDRTGVIFPASFAREFNKNPKDTSMAFFTPDSVLVKKLDNNYISQYCNAIRSETKSTGYNKISCLQWQANFPYYDRQYLGFITSKGEKIIHIKLLDFRYDPKNLKQIFTYSWIEGWHGWFYSNMLDFYYDIDKNSLSISEEL